MSRISRLKERIRKTERELGIAGDFLRFLWKRKLYWMIPFFITLLIFSMFVILAQTTPAAPFLYPLL